MLFDLHAGLVGKLNITFSNLSFSIKVLKQKGQPFQVCCRRSILQACSNLSTSLGQPVRAHPVNKLLQQTCYMSACRFVTSCAFLRVYYVHAPKSDSMFKSRSDSMFK